MIANSNNLSELPQGWALTELGEASDIIRGISFPKNAKIKTPQKGYIACLRTANVQRNVEWGDIWFVPQEFVKRDEQLVKKYDILISTANSLELVGKVCQVKTLPYPSTLGAFISLIRISPILDQTFFYFQLDFAEVQSRIRSCASTTTNISNVSTRKLAEIQLIVPPLPEQKRIVAKIEELFTKLDAGVEALKKVRQELKRYRQAVLKYAFEGKLTNASVEKDGVPKGWQRKKMGELTSFSQGIQVPVQNQFEEKGNVCVRFLRIIDFTQGKQKPRYIKNPGGRYCVAKDDLSMVRYGTAGFICTGLEGAIANNLFKIVPVRTVEKRFLLYFFKSPFFLRILTSSLKGVTMPAISFGLLKGLDFLLPPYCEQQQIVLEIERHFSVADQIEETIEQGLKQSDRLRQSILKRAFEGKLVPQNPENEPADKLLERIKAEKEKLKAEQKRKSRKELDNVKKGKRKDRRSEAM